MKLLLVVVIGLVLTTCVTQQKSARQHLELLAVEKIQLESFSPDAATMQLGKPDKIIPLPDAPAEDAWLYFEPGQRSTKLSLIFDRKSGALVRKTWFVGENEPEINLPIAKDRFPDSHFNAQLSESDNPHYISDREVYSDKKNGISISYLRTTNVVEAISWSNPQNRSLADDPRIKKPSVEWTP